MKFLNLEFLWHLLWIAPLLIAVFVSAWKKRSKVMASIGGNAGKGVRVALSKRGRVLRFLFLFLCAGLLVLAAARPSFGQRILELDTKGRDLLVVFDTSKSMLCKDVQPSRLDHAKWLVKELVKLNPGDRFGLVAFAGKAFLECPMTTDSSSFLQSVNELSVDSIPIGGTNVEEALTQAERAFMAAETTNRAVILVTDGDELEGNSAKLLNGFAAKKIPLFVVGVGDPGQPSIIQIPDGRGGVTTLKDDEGRIVNSPLNEKQLAELARKTDGIYVRSTSARPNLNALEKRIRALIPESFGILKTTQPIERFMYPLSAAFLCFLLWLLTGERPLKKRTETLTMLLLLSTLCLTAQTPDLQNEDKSAKQKMAIPDDPVHAFNTGVDSQRKGDFAAAAEAYSKVFAGAGENPFLLGKAAQNTGVLAHSEARGKIGKSIEELKAQNLDESEKLLKNALPVLDRAEEYYREAMRDAENPDASSKNQSILLSDRKSAENLLKKIEELKKQREQAQKETQQARDQQKKENQQKQDQQKQDQQKQDQQKQDQQKQDQQKQDQQKQDQQKQDQQKQDQQKQDQQKQDQQKQDQQKQDQQKQNQQKQDQQKQDQQKQDATAQTEQARQSANELKRKAGELGQKKLEESAERAKQELDKAREEQKKGHSDKAEEHLKKALSELSDGDNRKQDQQKQDQQKQDQQKQDQQKQDQGKSSDKPLPEPEKKENGKKQKTDEPKPGEIDRNQAEALLESMRGNEKNLRDELRARVKQHYKDAPVGKDW